VKLFSTVLAIFLALFSIPSFAEDQRPSFGGVETFACNFKEGKSMQDMLKVAKKWDKWMDKNASRAYSGFAMTPHYFSEPIADYYWVGFTTSFEDQGITDEEFINKGGAIQKAFDEIEVCNSRSQYMWSLVRDTFADPVSGGFVDFARCSFRDGAGMSELAAADAKMQSFLDGIGNTTRIYRWMPIQGTNLQGADFIQTQWEESLPARGKNMDAFINAGGVQQQAAIYDAVVKCVGGPSANYISVGGSE
jgi:hypothetical protein